MSRQPDQYADLHPSGYDYLLTAIAGSVTSYAAGVSVASPTIGWIFVVLTILGTWISFAVMRAIRGTRVVAWNGFIYTGGVLAAFFLSRMLVETLPENPFKAQIFVCGMLLWMLAFGSFLIWSDQTLLFQAVPSIAIFGLVGCYDTYRDAVWMFFAFLLCFATMLARVHSRTMLRQAKESGYSQSGERMDRSATELQRMRSGPWKWVAGPQWALGSAFVVILFSFIGAPIIRESVQGVAGVVRVNTPLPKTSTAVAATSFDPTGMRVGNGPLELSLMPVFRATLDRPRYMRTSLYQSFAQGTWQSVASQPVGDKTNVVLGRSGGRRAISEIKNRETIEYEIEPASGRLGVLPIPGEVTEIQPPENTTIRLDATLAVVDPVKINVYRGRSIVAAQGQDPTNAVRVMPPGMESLTASTGIATTVFELANRVAAQGKTDYERAVLIKQEIERRVKYNLLAPPVPGGADAVEYLLFQSKEGYCDLFASAMVLMARSVGIPARMVVGYYPMNGERDSNGRFVFKESDRHAWAELLFEGHGWVVFDATEGAVEVPGGERGGSTVNDLMKSDTFRIIVDILIGLGAVILLGITARMALAGMKVGPTRTDLDREYLRFVGVLAKASGKTRNFDQTPSEYVRDTIGFLNGEGQTAVAINAKFERLFYSNDNPTRESMKELRDEVNLLKGKVKSPRPKVA